MGEGDSQTKSFVSHSKNLTTAHIQNNHYVCRVKNHVVNRSWFTRLLCLWLTGSVLFASSGFVVVDHWCLMSGKKVEARLMPKACLKACSEEAACPQNKSTRTIHKTPCCKEVARYEHLKTEQSNWVHASHWNPIISDLPSFTQLVRFLSVLLSVGEPSAVHQQPDDPLIRSGRFRLISLCSWLI